MKPYEKAILISTVVIILGIMIFAVVMYGSGSKYRDDFIKDCWSRGGSEVQLGISAGHDHEVCIIRAKDGM